MPSPRLSYVVAFVFILAAAAVLILRQRQADPHRWLEDVEGPEALAWVRARNAATTEALAPAR